MKTRVFKQSKKKVKKANGECHNKCRARRKLQTSWDQRDMVLTQSGPRQRFALA
jgi:hypothetical protein